MEARPSPRLTQTHGREPCRNGRNRHFWVCTAAGRPNRRVCPVLIAANPARPPEGPKRAAPARRPEEDDGDYTERIISMESNGGWDRVFVSSDSEDDEGFKAEPHPHPLVHTSNAAAMDDAAMEAAKAAAEKATKAAVGAKAHATSHKMPVVWALRPKFRPIVNAKPRPAEHDVLLANNGQVYASPTCIADKWNQMGSLRR